MRFMVIVRSTEKIESGQLPSNEELTAMTAFNERLAKAGVLLEGEGLQPSSKGARIRFDGDRRTVIDGPFAETKELIAGYWIVQMKSKEEAIEWFRQAPCFDDGGVLEIRQIFEADDFGDNFTPELREAEARMRIGGLG
jgi:hypothetical protein